MNFTPPPSDAVGRLVAAPVLRAVVSALKDSGSVLVPGLWGSSVGAVAGAVARELGAPMLVVCGHLDEADDLADDIEVFVGRRPEVLPALELAGSLGGASEELVANRLQLVDRLSRWGEEGTLSNPIVVAPIQGLMQSVPSRGQMKELTRELRAGQKLEPEKLIVWLSEHGYNRLEQVEVPGDFAVRGGIVDVYLPGDHPGGGAGKSEIRNPKSEGGKKSEIRNPKSETNSNEGKGEIGENGGRGFGGGESESRNPTSEKNSNEEMGEKGENDIATEEWGEVGLPVRIDFFDDEIESIKRFSLETLGSLSVLQKVTLLDIRGKMPDQMGIGGESVSVLHYLPPGGVVAVWGPLEVAEQAKAYLDRLPEAGGIYPLRALIELMKPYRRLEMTPFKGSSALIADRGCPEVLLPVGALTRFETESKRAISELAELTKTHDVAVFCENEGERTRLVELLEGVRRGLSSDVEMVAGYLHRGFVFGGEGNGGEGSEAVGSEAVRGKTGGGADWGIGGARGESDAGVSHSLPHCPTAPLPRPLALIGHHELFNKFEQRRRVRKAIASRPVDSFLDLKVGDYVVHVTHGIAKFTGIQTLSREGKSEEYLTLRFAEEAVLHVPATRVNLIQKYIGGFSGHPTLSRLGSGVWEKQKAKVAEAVMDMAAELIEVQAARAKEEGLAYPADTTWQREFEAEFPYEPTADQVNAADEIKRDMEKKRPMDRLLCGDVGYGKTELAMRAAFKAAEFGKQVAVLVPTTVLAEQHERSFRARMGEYPFVVAGVSRFKTPKEIKETLAATKAGDVDVLIGTHRILSKDIHFADLGLVIVDEEQRFGVQHKERLKQMKKTVDVLTMSATPIPRTLSMSLLGLRDISSLTTAPQDRRSVVTEVMAYDANRVKLALQRELQREGQVYFVHNRVHSIQETAAQVQALVPDARILIGHGQMPDEEMEDVMMRFVRHEADILVCTTIIESGLDIPNANTIIIDNADRFGLSELHQLRGRVGRYKHRAYCYLLLPADRPVTPIAAKRLKAIEEYSHLGSGFKIAMRDLELRGAGNILGPEQSGHIATVGYEMYCSLLEEATRSLKNEPKEVTPEAHVDLGVSEVIPKSYIAGDRQRLDVYRRMTRCTSIEMLGALRQDMVDAHGEMPRQVEVLYAMAELKLLAGHFGVDRILKKEPDVVLTVRDAAKVQAGLVGAPGTVRVIDEKTVYLRMPPVFNHPETLLMTLKNLFRGAWEREVGNEAMRQLGNEGGTGGAGGAGGGSGAVRQYGSEGEAGGGSGEGARRVEAPLAQPRRVLDPSVLMPKRDGEKSAGARKVERAAKEVPEERGAAVEGKGADVTQRPSLPSPEPLRKVEVSAAERSRMAVQKHSQGGAANVKAAAKGDGKSAAQPKAVGGTTPNTDVDKLLSLRDMGILTDAEFAVALKRLIDRDLGKKK